MSSAEVGALRIRLGLDAGTFKRDLRDSETMLERFGNRVGSAMGSIVGHSAKLGLAVTAAAAAIGYMVKQSIDAADELGKLSQSLGIATEDLSRLRYAAALSDVDMAEFRTGVIQLTKSMQESSDPLSEGGRAFAALGVNVRDATGHMRPANEVLSQVADRFSGYADGANKTALAVALFGKAGDKLIPMLNAGSAGLREMGEESDKVGATISNRAAKAAEEFGDTLTRLKAVKDGLANSITARVLPALTTYAQDVLEAAKSSGILKGASDAVVAAIEYLSRAVSSAAFGIKRFAAEAGAAFDVLKALFTFDTSKISEAWKLMQTEVEKTRVLGEALALQQDTLWSGWLTNMTVAAAETPKAMAPIIASADALKDALRRIKDEQRAALDELLSDDTGVAADKMLALNAAVNAGIISQQQYGKAARQVAKDQERNLNDLLSQTSTTLGAMFQDSKGVAIAQALINTYQGVTKALSSYPPPIAQAMAGLQLAAGMAQVANIRKTTKDGGGGGSTASAGASSAATAAATAPAASAQPDRTMLVQGFRADELWRGDSIRSLVGGLLEYQRDGGRVVLA